MLDPFSSRQTPIITSKLLWHWNSTVGRQIRTIERIVTLRAKVHMAHQTLHDGTAVLPHCWEMMPVGLLIFIHQLILTILAMVCLFCWDSIVPHSVEAMSEIISLERNFCHPYCQNRIQIFRLANAAPQVVQSLPGNILLLSKHGKWANWWSMCWCVACWVCINGYLCLWLPGEN